MSGEFLRGNEKVSCTLAGAWDKELSVVMPNGSKRKIWQICPMPKAESRYSLWPVLDADLLYTGQALVDMPAIPAKQRSFKSPAKILLQFLVWR